MTSAELITALQSTRPVATDTLRERVRAIAAAEPAQRPSPFARPGGLLGGSPAFLPAPRLTA